MKMQIKKIGLRCLEPLWAHARRRSRLSWALARVGETYWRSYEASFGGSISKNGESRLVNLLATAGPLRTVFDVGANIGEWSAVALEASAAAHIHAFEVAPPTYSRLCERFAGESRISLLNAGLSNVNQQSFIDFFPDQTGLTTLLTNSVNSRLSPQRLEVSVITGDKYCFDNNIHRIDLLKIDVEGAESDVLFGFADMFDQNRIDVVQFEYGLNSIYSRFLLRDFYLFFSARNFLVGKLLAKGVHFRDYDALQENFIGENYVAVTRRRQDLVELLSLERGRESP